MIRKTHIIWFALIIARAGFSADLTLPSVFSDHMMLQREQPVPVWGTADAGAEITVEFAGQTKTTVADSSKHWKIILDPMPASSEPRKLTVSSSSSTPILQYSDVLVGDVWFCSGQSNMQFRFKRSKNWQETLSRTDCPQIRLYETPMVASCAPIEVQVALTNNPVHNEEAYWKVCSPESSEYFSAVAMYFGLKLHKDLGVPVGLIGASVGGSKIEAWTPPCGFKTVESLNRYYEATQNLPDLSGQLRKGKDLPSALYNGMVYGHIPYAIRGVIWYQGENNRNDGMSYVDKTRGLLNGWKKLWGIDFPFYFVQIAPYQYSNENPEIMPEFWEAQAEIVKQIPKTAMAVISDAATLDDIHPPFKKIPGERLALLAEAGTYGMDVVSTGPVFHSMRSERGFCIPKSNDRRERQTLEKSGDTLIVTFTSADGLTTRDGKAPDWFEIAGADGVYKPAQAEIQNSSVLLSSPDVSDPVAMRFGWSKVAVPNLINGAGLPASAFRSHL